MTTKQMRDVGAGLGVKIPTRSLSTREGWGNLGLSEGDLSGALP
jgi:hypothetical protein